MTPSLDRLFAGARRPWDAHGHVLARPVGPRLVRVVGRLRGRRTVLRRDLAHRVVERLYLRADADHEDRARTVTGADGDVARARRAMEVVPLPQRSLLLLDDQRAIAGEHEEPLLDALRVVERVRLARREDANMDAEVGEGELPRLEGVDDAALLLVANGERFGDVHDEPSLRRDVAAVRRLRHCGFLHGHSSSSGRLEHGVSHDFASRAPGYLHQTSMFRKRRPRGDAPPSAASAVAIFAVGGLIALLVLATITAFALSRIGRHEATRDAKRLTEVLGNDVVAPYLDDAFLRGDPAARARVDSIVRQHVLNGDFVRVKIWSPDGRILYSDRPELIGSRYRLGEDDRDILRTGGVDAEISDLSAPENRFERRFEKLLEVYMPIETTGGGRVLFETYLRFSDVAASGRDLWKDFLPALIGALIVLYLIQLPLAYSLARRLERTHLEREAALARALDASDVERRRIAADLHDGTVQELVAASYGLSAARERAAPGSEAAGALARAEQVCRTAIRELRSLLIQIYP